MYKTKKLTSVLCTLLCTTFLAGCSSPSIFKNADADASAADSSSAASSESSSASQDGSSASSESSTASSASSDAAVSASSAASASSTDIAQVTPYGPNEPVPDGNLNLVFIGDSQFDRWRNTGTSISELVGEEMNALHYNLGIGGTCAAIKRSQNSTTDDSAYSDANFTAITKILAGDIDISQFPDLAEKEITQIIPTIDVEKVDYYIIEYGYNDYISGLDRKDEDNLYDEHTYYGALRSGIEELKKISPNAHFLICSPCYAVFYNSSGKVIGDAYNVTKSLGSLAQYANEDMLLADEEGCMKLDAMSGNVMNLNSHTYSEYLEDKVHLSYRGRQVYAEGIRRLLYDDLGVKDLDSSLISIANY